MKRSILAVLILLALVLAAVGCDSGPRSAPLSTNASSSAVKDAQASPTPNVPTPTNQVTWVERPFTKVILTREPGFGSLRAIVEMEKRPDEVEVREFYQPSYGIWLIRKDGTRTRQLPTMVFENPRGGMAIPIILYRFSENGKDAGTFQR